jgi:hypothetical protein
VDVGRSSFQLANYGLSRWAMIPARRLYRDDKISAFDDFHLRRQVELEALKLYLAIAARRDRNTNLAHMTYDQIEVLTGIERGRIKSAISFLAGQLLIHVEHVPSRGDYGFANAYRLVHLDALVHMGTRLRGGAEIFGVPVDE